VMVTVPSPDLHACVPDVCGAGACTRATLQRTAGRPFRTILAPHRRLRGTPAWRAYLSAGRVRGPRARSRHATRLRSRLAPSGRGSPRHHVSRKGVAGSVDSPGRPRQSACVGKEAFRGASARTRSLAPYRAHQMHHGAPRQVRRGRLSHRDRPRPRAEAAPLQSRDLSRGAPVRSQGLVPELLESAGVGWLAGRSTVREDAAPHTRSRDDS